MEKKNKNTVKQDWRAYLQLIKKSNVPWLLLVGYFLVSLLSTRVTTDMIPYSSKIYTGEILEGSVIVKYVLLLLAVVALWMLENLAMYWCKYKTERNFQNTIWRSMVRMPMARLDRQNAETLPSRITSDTTMLSDQFITLISCLTSVYSIWITLGNVRKDSEFMASFMLKMLALLMIWMILASIICGRFQFKASARFQNTYAQFTSYITERLSNIPMIKSNAAEDEELDRAMKEIDSQYRATAYKVNVEVITTFAQNSINYVFEALVLFTAASMVRAATLDDAGMLTAYRYSLRLPIYLMTLMGAYLSIKSSQGAAATASDIVASQPETYKRKRSFALEDEDITLDNVSFSYGDKHVLEGASFTIPAGKVTALVGPNGCGKSTIAKLVERYYPPEKGAIRFGSCPVEDIHLDEWRKSIGYIAQSTTLLSGTLRENLTYALDRPVDDGELRQALETANLTDFVNRLDNGLDTDLGEMGSNLSGGERQRIAIARTVLRNPEYLILDEVTSALDAENRRMVLSALYKLSRGRTCLLISHDMDAVALADHIAVLSDGRIQDQGTHKELMERSPLYQSYQALALQ